MGECIWRATKKRQKGLSIYELFSHDVLWMTLNGLDWLLDTSCEWNVVNVKRCIVKEQTKCTKFAYHVLKITELWFWTASFLYNKLFWLFNKYTTHGRILSFDQSSILSHYTLGDQWLSIAMSTALICQSDHSESMTTAMLIVVHVLTSSIPGCLDMLHTSRSCLKHTHTCTHTYWAEQHQRECDDVPVLSLAYLIVLTLKLPYVTVKMFAWVMWTLTVVCVTPCHRPSGALEQSVECRRQAWMRSGTSSFQPTTLCPQLVRA